MFRTRGLASEIRGKEPSFWAAHCSHKGHMTVLVLAECMTWVSLSLQIYCVLLTLNELHSVQMRFLHKLYINICFF